MLACGLLPSCGIHCINEKATLCNTVLILSIDHHVPVMEVANVGNTMWRAKTSNRMFYFYVMGSNHMFYFYVVGSIIIPTVMLRICLRLCKVCAHLLSLIFIQPTGVSGWVIHISRPNANTRVPMVLTVYFLCCFPVWLGLLSMVKNDFLFPEMQGW